MSETKGPIHAEACIQNYTTYLERRNAFGKCNFQEMPASCLDDAARQFFVFSVLCGSPTPIGTKWYRSLHAPSFIARTGGQNEKLPGVRYLNL
jgi:hypothetical protein